MKSLESGLDFIIIKKNSVVYLLFGFTCSGGSVERESSLPGCGPCEVWGPQVPTPFSSIDFAVRIRRRFSNFVFLF